MMALLVVKSIARGHAFDRFGAANVVTTLRAALVAAAAGLIGEAPSAALAAVAAALALTVALLDGVDGWLARRTAMATPFGARFDMEVDAFLILVLAMLAWTLGKAGSWVVLAGAMRYLFLAAGFMWRWVSAPLPPSSRRKAICVLQIAGLAAVVSPLVTAPASIVLALLTVATLAWSFAVDTLWLRRNGV
jgi:phosphatidylglycerophosphate synthase